MSADPAAIDRAGAVAFTCGTADDDLAVDYTVHDPLVSFRGTKTVTVAAKTETTHNF